MNTTDTLLQNLINENSTPSVQYCIFNSGNIIHQFISGFADISKQITTDENTGYHAFSVTKTFTALAILQLDENNLLKIDEPVKKYFSASPFNEEITIKQLLTHSAGIPNPIPLSWIHLKEEHKKFDRNKFFGPLLVKSKQLKFKPNEKFAYSNLGYVMLGNIIEKVSGTTYENYISENILMKLGLKTSELGFTLNENGQHAKGYHKKFTFSNLLLSFLIDKSKFMGHSEGPWVPFKDYYVNGVSYGGLIGTCYAFVKYIQELLKPECNLISEKYKKMLFTENFTNGNNATGMCLSWFKGQLNGKDYYSHAGGGGGYYCEIRIYPEMDLGSVIMFNRTGMTDERFLNKVDSYFM